MLALENKIPPPLVMIIFGVIMWIVALITPGFDVSQLTRIGLSISILFLGVFFCLSGIVSFKMAKTTVNPLNPELASALVSSGIYRVSRNPMYVGFACLLVAWAVYLASPLAVLGVFGFVVFMNRYQIAPEERALTTLFGDEFTEYLASVRPWL